MRYLGSYPAVVLDDVASFVDLEHGFEFTVDNYVHGLFKCACKVYLDAEITLLRQVKQPPSQPSIEAEVGVAFAKVIARQLVAFILCLFTGGGEQVDVASNVASNVAAGLEVCLERFEPDVRRHRRPGS